MEYNIQQGQPFSFDSSDAEILRKILERYGIGLDALDSVQNVCILSRPYVGIIRLPSRTIIISPAQLDVTLNHVTRIYFFVKNILKGTSINDVLYDIDSTYFEIDFSAEYCRELKDVVRKGLPSKYKEVEVRSKYFTGRVDYIKTIMNIKMLSHSPVVSFKDDINLENPLNIVLSTALWKIKKSIDYRDFIFLAGKLPWVQAANIETYIDNVSFDRSNSYCRRAYDIAVMIIKEMFFVEKGSRIIGESFLVSYDKLFEDFVSLILIHLSGSVNFVKWEQAEEYGMYIENNIKYPKSYHPDMLYGVTSKTPPRALAVLDAKNKLPHIYSNEDVYQMLFYGNILDASRLLLIYPSTYYRNQIELNVRLKNDKEVKVRAVFINIVEESHAGFLKSIRRFSGDVKMALK